MDGVQATARRAALRLNVARNYINSRRGGTGGVAGLLLGLVVSPLLDGRSLGGQSFQTVFSGDIAILALVVSAGIGLFFGIYPAMRAARLHPIDALRYE